MEREPAANQLPSSSLSQNPFPIAVSRNRQLVMEKREQLEASLGVSLRGYEGLDAITIIDMLDIDNREVARG